MDAQTPSFMLLPDFTFLPDSESVQLGSILPLNKQTKLPDPRRPLNKQSRLPVGTVSEQSIKAWNWDSESKLSTKAGVNADISLLTGVGGGIGGGHSHIRGLKIDCERVETKTFLADPQYIFRSVSDDFINKLLKKISRPPVFLVTGTMTAYGAKIATKKEKGNEGHVHAAADVTQTGVPLNVGAELSVEKKDGWTLLQTPEKPFILAYQLIRIRKKYTGDIDSRDENAAALFHDEIILGGKEAQQLFSDFDVKTVDERVAAEESKASTAEGEAV